MKRKKLKCRIAAIITLVVVGQTMNLSWVNAQEVGEESLDEQKNRITTNVVEGQNYVNLEWTDLNYRDPNNDRSKDKIYSYRVYQKKSTEPESEYKAIPVKADSIRVLNVYPGDEKVRDANYKLTGEYVEPRRPAGDQLKKWINEIALEKVKPGEQPDKTLKDVVGDKNFAKYFGGEDKNVGYKYVRDEDGRLITNGRGIIEMKDGQPVKDENGEYVYYKNPIITVDCVDIRYFRGETIEDAEKIVGEDGKEELPVYTPEGFLEGEYLTDSKVIKKGLNLNPKDDKHQGKYAYDVVYEGGWDGNNGEDLNDISVNAIREFADQKVGKGFLQGHNTVNYAYNEKLKDLVGYKMGVAPYGDSKIRIAKRGYLTNYPWKIGDDEETLIIPPSHSCTDFSMGDVWMKYDNNTVYKEYGNDEKTLYEGEEGTNNFYLATHNNTASIETGHSNGMATPDEQKLLINTLCYLAQVGNENKCEDHTAQDFEAPDKPKIEESKPDFINNKLNLSLGEVKDNGTSYDYYVSAKNLSASTDEPEVKIDSDSSVEVKTGFDKYLIICDNKPNTDIKNVAESNVKVEAVEKRDKFYGMTVSNDKNIEVGLVRGNSYIHVAVIDKAGNISETTTKSIVNPYTILGVEKDGEDEKVENKEEFLVNITLNHIENENEDFPIHSINKISREIFTVKYDKNKLNYQGISNLYEGFRILSTNEEDGEITFKVLNKNLIEYPIKKNMCTIVFEAKEEGEANLSIENASIIDTDKKENPLKLYQCGMCNINIADNFNK